MRDWKMFFELSRQNLVEFILELNGLELRIDELKGGITNKLYRVQSSGGHDLIVRLYG